MARSAFLTPDFSPTEFLSSLRNRHQTLEDLRQELRDRSQELNKELLDLVNEDYQEFLALGTTLKGGDDKVEEVRLGLLGFKREVDALKKVVEKKRQEADGLFDVRKDIAREMRRARALLEVDARLTDLEESLRIVQAADGDQNAELDEFLSYTSSEDDSDEADFGTAVPLPRLKRRVEQFVHLKRMIARLGSEHPFLRNQEQRISSVKQVLLLDMKNALISCHGQQSEEGIMTLLAQYQDMNEPGEALEAILQSRY